MVVKFTDSNHLLQNAIQEQLYEKLVAQLQKDFTLANIHIDLSPADVPETVATAILKSTLHEKVYFLIMERFSEYLNLLYIVDVPEKEVKKIEATDAVEIAGQVSFLILKRAWQKVWFRAQYNKS